MSVSTKKYAASPSPGADGAAEVQGLYGPFTFPEKLLQKIWLRGDFDHSRAIATDGRSVKIVYPGRWNLLGGPDFRHARLRFGDGPEIVGDVELHLHAGDWAAHRHADDHAYDDVALHVVLFSPALDHVTHGAGGRTIPVLALLPLLHHDLEEYAAEDAIESISGRPAAQILDSLGPLSADELTALLRRHADERFAQKVHFARLRVQRLGWDEACHHTALEILGYRFNRAPMLRLAGAHPLAAWAAGLDPHSVFATESAGWSLQGVRPANHPRNRLGQYARWAQARPDWPAKLVNLGSQLPRPDPLAATGDVRHAHGFTALRRAWSEEIAAGEVAGTRFDNLMCDGLLPLLAARGGLEVRGLWQHWFAGDLPPIIVRALRQLGIFSGRKQPAAYGVAQGLLGWLIAQERAAVSAGRGA